MTNALPTLLLVLALCFQAQAHSSFTGRFGSLRVDEFADKQGVSALLGDTAKANNSRLLTSTQLRATRSRAIARQVAGQGTEQLTLTDVVALKEAGEFNPEAANLPAALAITLRRPEAPLGRRTFRTRLVRTGRWASHPEAVEILTCTYAGPLVLAQLPATATTPSQLLAGPGYDPATPLRPLALTQEAVLRLCGDRAPQVRAYAMLYNLHFQQADEVARLLDYYNRIAVVK